MICLLELPLPPSFSSLNPVRFSPSPEMIQMTLDPTQPSYTPLPPISGLPPPSNGLSGEAPPPVPPRTYSNRSTLTNGRPTVARKPMRKYRLEEFRFLKLLGKGSFGKVPTQAPRGVKSTAIVPQAHHVVTTLSKA